MDRFSLGGDLMTRVALLISCAAISLFSVGCCGPIGPGCRVPMGCSDCDGIGHAGVIAGSPRESLRNLRRSLVCGSGCGEAYIGEWMSTPPDAADPCCGDQWVGGATKCRPFCWEPGTILGNFYGGRFCSGAESSAPCGCGVATCDGGCEGEYIDEGYIESGMPSGGSACGCATCNAQSSLGSSTRVAGRIPTVDPMTRSSRTMNQRVRR